ncbi:MAG: hypothetical protein HY647_08005 [Acidobacteria bacterium]|nr:hypothetical protein [Acidobacteriota bacterium]
MTEKLIQEELAGLIARYTGAASRLVKAYGERRTRERDIYWLALQATKEYGAMVYHSGAMWRKAKAMEPLKSIRKSSQDSYEEAEHFRGYMEVLNWYLEDKPCEVSDMWDYGDISGGFGPGPGMKKWPEHYGYFELGDRLCREARSEWIREAILANREGAAVGFHYAMSKLPVTDEFSQRIAEHERSVAEDELHHGSEIIPELAQTLPSPDQLEEAKRLVTDVHVQELRQRNEQFLNVLTPQEMKQLEDDLCQNRIETIPIFSLAVAQ